MSDFKGRHFEGEIVLWAVRAEHNALRLRGALFALAGGYDEADGEFARAEALLAAHEGPRSLAVANERAEHADLCVKPVDLLRADEMMREALAMAAPLGRWRTPAWARIAVRAADVADRMGQPARAARLRGDAADLLPPAAEQPRLTAL